MNVHGMCGLTGKQTVSHTNMIFNSLVVVSLHILDGLSVLLLANQQTFHSQICSPLQDVGPSCEHQHQGKPPTTLVPVVTYTVAGCCLFSAEKHVDLTFFPCWRHWLEISSCGVPIKSFQCLRTSPLDKRLNPSKYLHLLYMKETHEAVLALLAPIGTFVIF